MLVAQTKVDLATKLFIDCILVLTARRRSDAFPSNFFEDLFLFLFYFFYCCTVLIVTIISFIPTHAHFYTL